MLLLLGIRYKDEMCLINGPFWAGMRATPRTPLVEATFFVASFWLPPLGGSIVANTRPRDRLSIEREVGFQDNVIEVIVVAIFELNQPSSSALVKTPSLNLKPSMFE